MARKRRSAKGTPLFMADTYLDDHTSGCPSNCPNNVDRVGLLVWFLGFGQLLDQHVPADYLLLFRLDIPPTKSRQVTVPPPWSGLTDVGCVAVQLPSIGRAADNASISCCRSVTTTIEVSTPGVPPSLRRNSRGILSTLPARTNLASSGIAGEGSRSCHCKDRLYLETPDLRSNSPGLR